MDYLVMKCREMKNKSQLENCERLNSSYLEISMGLLEEQDRINEQLVLLQLDKIGFITNKNRSHETINF